MLVIRCSRSQNANRAVIFFQSSLDLFFLSFLFFLLFLFRFGLQPLFVSSLLAAATLLAQRSCRLLAQRSCRLSPVASASQRTCLARDLEADVLREAVALADVLAAELPFLRPLYDFRFFQFFLFLFLVLTFDFSGPRRTLRPRGLTSRRVVSARAHVCTRCVCWRAWCSRFCLHTCLSVDVWWPVSLTRKQQRQWSPWSP